jgi:hypothetical protein
MSIETIPRAERYEIDPTVFDEPLRLRRYDMGQMAQILGRVALKACGVDGDSVYFRYSGYLSSEDIEQLEIFYALLRSHYGIPNDQPVFPKREDKPVASVKAPKEPEESHAS